MAQQKLYTEEQVNELRRALKDIAQWNEDLEDMWEDAGSRATDALKSFKNVTSIELPSDEEIENDAKSYHEKNKLKSDYPHCPYSFEDGAKWLKDKILNQNKQT
jgi:seryl-tRNA synthetase